MWQLVIAVILILPHCSASWLRPIQCRIKLMGATDAAALGPFKKKAHGHGRERKISILVVISLVGTILGKSLKLLPPDGIF